MSGIQFMSCTAEATVHGREPGYPYLAVLMNDWDDSMDGGIVYGDNTHGIVYIQSAYPFYVYWYMISQSDTPQPHLMTFARGEKTAKVTLNWDNYKGPNHSGDSSALPHAYLHNCVVEYSDAFDGNAGSIGYGVESYIENGVDKIRLPSDYATIVNEGEHLGASRIVAGTVGLYKSTSRLPSDPEVSPSGYAGTWMRTIALVHCINNHYSNNYISGKFGDYRIIYNKPFSSMQEWFDWCKTH